MKFTWYSNAPWGPTGYGQQTALFTPRIQADGHDVQITANWGLNGAPVDWNGIPVIGAGYDAYSNDLSPAAHVRFLDGDKGWMFTLFDAWVLRFPELAHVASWMPVDHLTVPPEVLAWAKTHYSVAMSRFGQEAFRDAGVEARYVPHAVDTSIFRPGAIIEKHGVPWRAVGNLADDAFVIGIVGANKGFPSRKGFPEMFSAAAIFMAAHPDVHLYVHSDISGYQGVHLEELALGLRMPMDRLHFVDQFANRAALIPDRDMAAIYSGLDVFLNTSYGEGFGVPIIEAQACGVPVIVTDATAMSELVAPGGWKVSGQPWYNAPQRSWWVVPSIARIIGALEDAYDNRGQPERRAAAREFALGYDIDHVYATHFRPVLAEMEALLAEKPARTGGRGARKRHRR